MRKPRTAKEPAPAPTPAQLPSVIDQAVGRLRKMIMLGELRPGQKLVEADLCRDLAVSRASIREALRIMEKERLIELIPNRGALRRQARMEGNRGTSTMSGRC